MTNVSQENVPEHHPNVSPPKMPDFICPTKKAQLGRLKWEYVVALLLAILLGILFIMAVQRASIFAK